MPTDIKAFVGVDGRQYVLELGKGANREDTANLYRMHADGQTVECVTWGGVATEWPYVAAYCDMGQLPAALRDLAGNLMVMRRRGLPLYALTGIDRYGKRFSFTVRGPQAFYYNLWRGHIWRVDEHTGRRKLVKSYYN